MENCYVKGQILLIKTKDGNLQGSYHSTSADNMTLTLTNVKWLPMECSQAGLFHLSRSEILSMQLLEPGSSAVSSKETEPAHTYRLMRHVPLPANAGPEIGLVKECHIIPNYNPHQPTSHPSSRRKIQKTNELVTKLYIVTERYIFVEERNAFEVMIENLKEELMIAIEFEGIIFGSWNEVGLINVATWDRTFLIDMKKIGLTEFDMGLKDILESEKIVKIIHNCRLISAILFHEYGVLLKNVFDTQVADLCRIQQCYQQLPLVVRSLPDCLAWYLNLPESLLHRPCVRDGYIKTDLHTWIQRPLHLKVREKAVKNGVFLLLLQRQLKPENEKAFKFGCELYLNIARNLDRSALDTYLPNMFMVPPEMLEMKKLINGSGTN